MSVVTVADLIEALQGMPKDAEVYYRSGPFAGCTHAEEIPPVPSLEDDGRVLL